MYWPSFIIIYLFTGSSYGDAELGLPLGAQCAYEKYNLGKCVNIYDCPRAAATYIYNKTGYFSLGIERPKICSYDQQVPIVCCSDCQPPVVRFGPNDVAVATGNIRRKNGPVAWNKCLDYFKSLPYRLDRNFRLGEKWDGTCHHIGLRVWLDYKGRIAERSEFPHVALLGYGADQQSAEWLCGGSIISERYILTAAHCTTTPKLGPIKYAALGIQKQETSEATRNIYNIKRVIMHPDYKSPSKYNDIALVETENEIIFSSNILPACLDVGKLCNTLNRGIAEVVSWEKSGDGSFADHLKVTKLEEYDENKCSKLYGPHKHMTTGYNHTTQMCYGSPASANNTCENYGGAPLLINDENIQYDVVGVTSFHSNCGDQGSAAIYTRVRAYVPWIESVVWLDEKWTDAVGSMKDSFIYGTPCS